eukprot:1200855-Rhodomonas_salina.2
MRVAQQRKAVHLHLRPSLTWARSSVRKTKAMRASRAMRTLSRCKAMKVKVRGKSERTVVERAGNGVCKEEQGDRADRDMDRRVSGEQASAQGGARTLAADRGAHVSSRLHGSSSATRAEVIASSVSAQHQPDIEGSPVSTASVPESRKGASPPESASEGAMLAIDWTREKRDERQCCLPVWSIPPYSPAQPSPKEAAGSNCTMGMSR